MWAWGGAYVATGAALLLSLSRGGIGCFGAAQLGFVAAWAWTWRGSTFSVRAPGTRKALWAAVAVIAASAVGLAIASDDILAELASANTVEKLSHSKIELWPSFARAVVGRSKPEDVRSGYLRFGMGRGAFESGYTRFQDQSPELTFTHPENALAQLACEFGLAPTALLLALFGAGLFAAARARVRRDASALDVALLAGAVGLLAHNIVDFNLELSPCAVALWTALGIVSRGESSSARAPSPIRPRAGLLVAIGAGAFAAVALAVAAPNLGADERALRATAHSGIRAEQLEAAALPAIDRHPADYALYETVGSAYVAERPSHPREGLAFMNRVLFLKPIDAQAHWVAARALLALRKRPQAFLEYRLALEAAFVSAKWSVLQDAAAKARTSDELRAMVPDDPEWIARAVRLGAAGGFREAAETCLQGALEDHGAQKEGLPLWLVAAELESSQGNAAGALEKLEAAEKLSPGDLSLEVLKAKVLEGANRADEAVAVLAPLVSSHPASLELALALAHAYVAGDHPRQAVEALERIRPFVTANDLRAQILMLEADAYARDGRFTSQLDAYRSAARLQPNAPGHHYNAAHVLEALGRSGDALEEIRAGLHVDGSAAAASLKPWMDSLAQKKKDTEDAVRQRALLR